MKNLITARFRLLWNIFVDSQTGPEKNPVYHDQRKRVTVNSIIITGRFPNSKDAEFSRACGKRKN